MPAIARMARSYTVFTRSVGADSVRRSFPGHAVAQRLLRAHKKATPKSGFLSYR